MYSRARGRDRQCPCRRDRAHVRGRHVWSEVDAADVDAVHAVDAAEIDAVNAAEADAAEVDNAELAAGPALVDGDGLAPV